MGEVRSRLPQLGSDKGLRPIRAGGFSRGKWASLVAQMVKNLPAMQVTQVKSLGGEDPLEKGMASDSSILA